MTDEERLNALCNNPGSVVRLGKKKIFPHGQAVIWQEDGENKFAAQLCFIEMSEPCEDQEKMPSLALWCPAVIEFQTRESIQIVRRYLDEADKILTRIEKGEIKFKGESE